MGMLVEGQWHSDTTGLVDDDGALQRPESVFRNWITADGAPGPTGDGGFEAEPGRYHLYVARACPWAHRATLFRELKGLQAMVGLSVTHWLMAEDGWTFATGPGVIPDPLHDVECLWQLYVRADPVYSGRVTVPVLWDTQRETIVSNESADIIRMFNSA
ncbi:MAG: glutathione S-transferase family protein, partial [Luteimonas sp.]